MTTTGISAAAVAGGTYTATIEYANVSWNNCTDNESANVALNILANGAIVGTGTLSGLAQNSPWTPVTATWTASSGYAGQAIQLQVVATNFLEGPVQWQVPTFAFANATLTAALPLTVPAAPSGLAATAVSSSQVNLSWTNNAGNQTGFQIDQATNSAFTAGLTTVSVGAGATTYSATALSASNTYYYRVRATNSAGASANSSTASAMTGFLGTPVAVTVPDANFTDTPGGYINSNNLDGWTGGAYTLPMTGTLSGWSLSANPSTANGGNYSSNGWGPFGVLDSVTSGGSGSPYSVNNDVGSIGNQPGSSYNAFLYYPGEQYANNDVLAGAQPGASLTMTTTGISATAVAGNTYTATIQYANVSSSSSYNTSPNIALNILANGVVVGTGTLSGLAYDSPWTTVTATWVAQAANAGQAIQLQVVATNFLEGPSQWAVPTFAVTHATLAAITPIASLAAWTSPVNGLWNSGTNWTNTQGSGVPGFSGVSGDHASFNGSAGLNVDLGNFSPSIAGLTFGPSAELCRQEHRQRPIATEQRQ